MRYRVVKTVKPCVVDGVDAVDVHYVPQVRELWRWRPIEWVRVDTLYSHYMIGRRWRTLEEAHDAIRAHMLGDVVRVVYE